MHTSILEKLEETTLESERNLFAKTLHDNYTPYKTDAEIWRLIKEVFPDPIYKLIFFDYQSKVVGHKIVNDIVMAYYYGEKKVKYSLASKYINRDNEVSIFEFNVGKSRLDYARINGYSYAFEIKTELDSLDKLEKQLLDYEKVFDYIHVVTHISHFNKVQKIVPDYCGIWTYNPLPQSCKFKVRKKRKKNINIHSSTQLESLNLKELQIICKKYAININNDREEIIEKIILMLSREIINDEFKSILKKRFEKRWSHVNRNFESIQPIDIQSCFKSLLNPEWLYYKNSSIVYK